MDIPNETMAIHHRKIATPVHDTDQPNAFHPANGKGTTDERLRKISRGQVIFRELVSTIQLKLSRLDSDEALTIPYTIKALDLAADDNDLLQHLRPLHLRNHDTPRGALRKKKNARRNSTEHRKNGPPVAKREIKPPRCRFGTRRMLDDPRDDLGREVCWFHKQNEKNENKWGEKCRKW